MYDEICIVLKAYHSIRRPAKTEFTMSDELNTVS